MERSIFSEDHDIFRRNFRRFVDTRVVPWQAAWRKQGAVDREIWLEAGADLAAIAMTAKRDAETGGRSPSCTAAMATCPSTLSAVRSWMRAYNGFTPARTSSWK